MTNDGQPGISLWRRAASAFRDPAAPLGACLSAGLFLAISWLPILGVFLGIFCPAPILYLYYRRGRVVGLAVAGLASLLVIAVYVSAGRLVGGLVYVMYALLGVIMAEGLLRAWRPEKTVGAAAAAVLVMTMGLVAAGGLARGQAPWTYGRQSLEHQVRESFKLYDSLLSGAPEAPPAPGGAGRTGKTPEYRRLGLSNEDAAKLVESLLGVFPGLMILGTLLAAWANFMVCLRLLRKRHGPPPGLADLKRWRAPEWLVWFVIVCGFGLFLPLGDLKIVGVNGLLVLGLIYFFQGISVVAYWLDRKAAPTFMRVILYSIIALQQYLALLVAAVGLFDLWFDFRRLKRAGEGQQA